MKNKLVLWGSNDKDEKVLLAIELLSETSQIRIFTFPEQLATEAFSKLMMEEWRLGKPVEFPEGYQMEDRPLTVTGSMLPEGYKVEQEDILQRAQTEWHFIVLSEKLHRTYEIELQELKEKVAGLESFDNNLWEEAKGFWDKVQNQLKERNLFREQAEALRSKTNEVFADLKQLRSKLDDEFKERSKEQFERFQEKLADLEKRIADGLRVQPIFNELKELQKDFRNTKFTREHRNKVWERLDQAFKTVKEKRFGTTSSGDSSPVERLDRRYQGLISAIEKMERSIKRDEDDLVYQNRKIERTDGQLEAQIRQAKIKMIEERIRSKKEKHNEMLKTKEELERRMERAKGREAKRLEREKLEEAKRKVEQEIKEEIQAAAEAREDEADKLEKAAEDIKVMKSGKKPASPPKESVLDAIGHTLGESLEDVVDTVKAVAHVLGGQIEEKVDELRHQAAKKKAAAQEEEKPVVSETEEEEE